MTADDVTGDDMTSVEVRADGVRADGVSADGVTGVGVTADGVRWLDSDEQQVWRDFLGVVIRLPSALEARLKEHGDLSLMEYLVLAYLSDAPGESRRMTAIAAEAGLSPSRLSHLMGRLEKRGLVTRGPGGDDGRTITATLTSSGLTLVERVAPHHLGDVRELVFDRLTPAQVLQLGRIAAAVAARA